MLFNSNETKVISVEVNGIDGQTHIMKVCETIREFAKNFDDCFMYEDLETGTVFHKNDFESFANFLSRMNWKFKEINPFEEKEGEFIEEPQANEKDLDEIFEEVGAEEFEELSERELSWDEILDILTFQNK